MEAPRKCWENSGGEVEPLNKKFRQVVSEQDSLNDNDFKGCILHMYVQ